MSDLSHDVETAFILLVHRHHIKHIVKEVGDNRSRELEKQFNEKF